jgi:pimeloyl-ACP methyl ester carboxylesterase
VIAAANPLRGVEADAQYVGRIVAAVHGPVVLVGHSYGGSVISQAAAAAANVKALVYVAAFAPDAGASHVLMISHPGEVAETIEAAARN